MSPEAPAVWGRLAVCSRLTLLGALGRKGLGDSWQGLRGGSRAELGTGPAPPACAQDLGVEQAGGPEPPAATPTPAVGTSVCTISLLRWFFSLRKSLKENLIVLLLDIFGYLRQSSIDCPGVIEYSQKTL